VGVTGFFGAGDPILGPIVRGMGDSSILMDAVAVGGGLDIQFHSNVTYLGSREGTLDLQGAQEDEMGF